MIVTTKKHVSLITIFIILCILSKDKLVKAQYHGGQEMMSNYGGSGYVGYGGSGGDGGHLGQEEVDERPKVQLGIRLKIPAIKFELPRVNLPKITVSAKIRQPDGPRVISLPEINLDTSSKVEPPGAQSASGGGGGNGGQNGGDHYAQNTGYTAKRQPYYANENVQTFSFSTQGDDSPRANHLNTYNHYGNQYRGSNSYRNSYSSTNSQPMHWNQNHQYYKYNNNNNKPKTAVMPAENSYHHNMINDADLGFNSPVYMTPVAESRPQYSILRSNRPNSLRNLLVESGGRFKRNHG